MLTLNEKLTHAIMEYDRKASTRRGYNPNALGLYFGALSEAQAKIDKGADVRKVLTSTFNDRLLTALLKAAGLD